MKTRDIEETLSPKQIVHHYVRNYRACFGKAPKVRHMGGYWYQVDGKIRHRNTLTREMMQLRQAAERKRRESGPKKIERSMVQRLIERIRAL